MLYVIGLYHHPPNLAESETRPQFMWVLLAGPFTRVETANYCLQLERDTPLLAHGGKAWRAIYRMVCSGERLAWYGLSADGPRAGQGSYLGEAGE